MTSQVAVYNMNGIAIASDTVVTSSSDAGSKTTSNAEKIYEIGAGHKVLVMHYGSTKINDLHHQFHFNEWALTLREPFGHLEDYVDSYIAWATASKLHSPSSESQEIESAIRNYFGNVRDDMERSYKNWTRNDEISDDEAILELQELNEIAAKEGLNFLKSLDNFSGMTDVKAKATLETAKIEVGKIVDEIFEGYYISSKCKKSLVGSAPQVIARYQGMPWDSFLAFTGYGAADPFPAVQVLICRSIYAGQLIHVKEEQTVIKPGPLASEISRFAQGRAIQAFLQGYNNDIMEGFKWAIDKHVRELAGEAITSEVTQQIKANVVGYIEDHSWRRYINPVLRHVSGMNLHALSELARNLVSIEAGFSESQDGPVSVGGLIEVATIDRVSGVRWKTRLPR